MTQRQIRAAARRLVLEMLSSLRETPWMEARRNRTEEDDVRIVRAAARIVEQLKARYRR